MRVQSISDEALEAFNIELDNWTASAARRYGDFIRAPEYIWEPEPMEDLAPRIETLYFYDFRYDGPSHATIVTHDEYDALTGIDRSDTVPDSTSNPEQESSVPTTVPDAVRGYEHIVTRRTHETGTNVGQYRRGVWAMYRAYCEAHDTYCATYSMPELRRLAAHPRQWCLSCADGLPPRAEYTGPTRTARARAPRPAAPQSLGMLRKFGVELECIHENWPNGYPNDNYRAGAYVDGYGNLANKIGELGLPVYPSTTDRLRAWCVKEDGSVRNSMGRYAGGFEVTSPVLQGIDGLSDLRRVMDMLNAEGFETNNTCGLHVHLDVGDLNERQVAAFARTWLSNQELIDWFVHERRRTTDYAEYCRPITEEMVREAERCPTKEEIPYYVRGGRYYTVNLGAIGDYGTIEIRQHHGTLSYYEVESWVRFAIGMIDAICQKGEALPKTLGIRGLLEALPVNDDAKSFLIGNALRNGAPVDLLVAA